MSEFSDYSGMSGESEHEIIRLMPGNIEAVRVQLADALERLGYRVLDENPLRARRRVKGWGQSGCSTDVLESAISLNVGLKAVSPSTTRVTFDYTVKNPFLVAGDRHTLQREAEALIALATTRATAAVCVSCGAEIVAGARFCRQCGAPNTLAEPAELEVLRLTANSRAAYHSMTGGLGLLLAALAVASLFFLLDQDAPKFAKRVKLIMFLASLLGGVGLPMLLAGFWRLHSMLKVPEQDETPSLPRRSAAVPNTASLAAASPGVAALPAADTGQAVLHSVTESTTDLLPVEKRSAGKQA
jgi:ribosomal protein L40E